MDKPALRSAAALLHVLKKAPVTLFAHTVATVRLRGIA
jgi:hypothetical protein